MNKAMTVACFISDASEDGLGASLAQLAEAAFFWRLPWPWPPARPSTASTRRNSRVGLGLAFLHKRDAGSAVRNAVAIENSQVHEIIAKDMSHDRRERLSAVNVRKEPVAIQARRREPDNAANSRENFGH
jgi:hypothetical protein